MDRLSIQESRGKPNLYLFCKEASMRMLRAIPVLMLLCFISLPVVSAIGACRGCCGCTMSCGSGCCCPGTYGCATCAAEDFAASQSNSTEANSDTTTVYKPIISIATNSRMLDRMIRVGQTGQCAVSKFAFRILADGQQLPYFQTIFFPSTARQDSTVAMRD